MLNKIYDRECFLFKNTSVSHQDINNMIFIEFEVYSTKIEKLVAEGNNDNWRK